jgi:excisionase family DNA binding protein
MPRSLPRNQPGALVLRVQEVAELLDVNRATVYLMVRRGELPHVRVAKAIRVARADVEAYVSERVSRSWKRVDRRGPRTRADR